MWCACTKVRCLCKMYVYTVQCTYFYTQLQTVYWNKLSSTFVWVWNHALPKWNDYEQTKNYRSRSVVNGESINMTEISIISSKQSSSIDKINLQHQCNKGINIKFENLIYCVKENYIWDRSKFYYKISKLKLKFFSYIHTLISLSIQMRKRLSLIQFKLFVH